MRCDGCGKQMQMLNAVRKKFYCRSCYLQKIPPILVLARLWSAPQTFFNPQTLLFEYRTIDELRECGFVLFNVRTSRKTEIDKRDKFKEILIFRYRGKLKCPRIANYSWPAGIKSCATYLC